MLDNAIKKIYNKYLKYTFVNNYKYIVTIMLYFLYQINFFPSLIISLGFNFFKLPKTPRMLILGLTDLVYIVLLILMYKKEIKKGLVDLKKNFKSRASIMVNCWLIGCIIMFISSFLISFIIKKDVSTNEALVRESIKLAPIYMLFTCSIIAPIFEEMVFRNSLYGLIKKKWAFIIISGLAFGLLHVIGNYTSPLDFLYIIPYGAMGSSFAYLFVTTNNITLPIAIHMIHNTILVITQILGG